MQKRTKIILASTVAVVFLAGAVGVSKAKESFQGGFHSGSGFMKHARFGGHRKNAMHEKIFDKFDTNKDGTITKAEITGVRKSELAKYDANKDGKLSLNEFQSLWTDLMRDRMVDHFQRLDNDGDASVTESEIAKPMNRMMSFLDRNNDGAISKDELKRKGRGHGMRRGGHGSGHDGSHDGDHHDDDDKGRGKK
jgi:Ca2+-binding EF-hand superfamily protein